MDSDLRQILEIAGKQGAQDIRLTCPHCGQHIEAPAEMAGMTVSCPSCSDSIDIPDTRGKEPIVSAAHSKQHSVIALPAFWWSLGITAMWGCVTFSQYSWRLEKMFGTSHPYLLACLSLAGILLLTWLSAFFIGHFSACRRLPYSLSLSLQIAAFILFGAHTALHFALHNGLWSTSQFSTYWFDKVTTWMSMYAAGLGALVVVSAVLLLITSMLKAPTGWLRLTLAAAVLLSIAQLLWIFVQGSAFLVDSPELEDFASLVHHERFFQGLVFLVGIITETLLRACIAFALSFATGNAVMWIRQGFPRGVSK